jgi:hypothetical protein
MREREGKREREREQKKRKHNECSETFSEERFEKKKTLGLFAHMLSFLMSVATFKEIFNSSLGNQYFIRQNHASRANWALGSDHLRCSNILVFSDIKGYSPQFLLLK